MIQELKVQELAEISGGDFSLYGIGGGNLGQYFRGRFGLSYEPEGNGFGFSYRHNVAHVNGVGTFSKPDFMGITFKYTW